MPPRLTALSAGVIAGLAAGWAGTAPAAEFRRGDVVEGPATHIRDGASLLVGQVPVRLLGVAAPGRLEPGGPEATEALRRIVQGRTLRCSLTGRAGHGLWDATCWVGTVDIGGAVIASGRARECPRASGNRYAALEREAAGGLPLPRHCR